MHERFDDPVKAACYIGLGLSKDFPERTVGLTFHASARIRYRSCTAEDASLAIAVLCKKFPRASVYYDPKAKNGVVAEIRCHCEDYVRRTCCGHGIDRPRVFVRLKDVVAEQPLEPVSR